MLLSCRCKISARRRYASEQPPDGRLLASRKVTKEDGIGEALTAKPIAAACIVHHNTPASSRPPLCTPPGAGRKTFSNRFSTTIRLPTGAGRGSGGRVAQSWGRRVGLLQQSRKTLRSTPPPSRFLWFVSCADTRNEHVPKLLDCVPQLNDKLQFSTPQCGNLCIDSGMFLWYNVKKCGGMWNCLQKNGKVKLKRCFSRTVR